MKKSVSIVEARRSLGRLADQVRRTRQGVSLTRRGRTVAQIVPEARSAPHNGEKVYDALGPLRGTLVLRGTFQDLSGAIRGLRRESANALDLRARRWSLSGKRRD